MYDPWNYLVLTISIIVLSISSFMMKRASGSLALTKINLMSFTFYVFMILQCFVGSIILVIYPEERYNLILAGIYDTSIYTVGWAYILYMMLAFPFGALLAKPLFFNGSVKEKLDSYLDSPILPHTSRKDSFQLFVLYPTYCVCILVTIYVLYYVGLGTIKSAFSIEDQVKLLMLRKELSENFSGNLYIKNILGMLLTPLMCYTSFLYYKLYKKKIDLIIFLFLFLCSAFLLSYKFEKSPFILFLLGFFFIKTYLDGGVSKKAIMAFSISLMIMLCVIYIFVTKNSSLDYLFSPFKEGIIGRIVISGLSSFYAHLVVFPDAHDFIGISSLSNFVSGTIGESVSSRSGRVILELFAPGWVEKGYGGVFNTIFLGEAWANFGLIGIIVSPVWVGFVHGSLYYFLLNKGKSPIYISLMAYFSYKSSMMGGINDYVYNMRMGLLVIVVGLIIWLAKMIHKGRS